MKASTTIERNNRILVIDDNPAIHDDFRKILGDPDPLAAAEARLFGKEESASFELDFASQGEEGLRLVQQAQGQGRAYAMAFIDVRMPPGLDGIETTKRIWEMYPDLQVVICTAYSDYSWSEVSAAIGQLDQLLILKKPFDPIEVQQLVHALTEKWRLQQVSRLRFADLKTIVKERTREIDEARLAALNVMEDALESRTRTEQANATLRTEMAERKRSEEALRTSEERFQQLAENVDEVFWMTDKNLTRILYVSPACEKVWGRTCQNLYENPLSFAEAVYPEDLVRLQTMRASQKRGEESEEEYRMVRPDGSMRWIRDRSFPVRDSSGEIYRMAGVAEDITERKQTELRLAAHHALTRALAESATLGEIAKKILQMICEATGWDVGGLWTVDRTTQRLRCVDLWHPPSTEFNEFVAASRETSFGWGEGLPGRVWESGEPSWLPELDQNSKLLRKALAVQVGLRSASAFPIRLNEETVGVIDFFSARIRSPDRELVEMLSTVGSQIGSFIGRKQVEEQFRQSQKMEAFGQLAGGVAHDFNNLLAVILGYSNFLLERDDLGPQAKEQLKQVYSAGERAVTLTRQLLTFSRKKEMEVKPLDLNEAIASMSKMLGRIIGEDIKLECSYASDPPSIHADQGMMEQLVMNLAVNARDAMPEGGRLTIRTEHVVTDADSVKQNPEARTGEFICMSVEDTGCGMTPEVKSRIFEPFFTTKGVGKGTGLGLATVYGVVKQHQGWLEVESQVGEGTTFKVWLPATPRMAAAVEQAVPETMIRGGNETILVVEDEPVLREMTRIILERFGYRILEAGTGVEALAVWKTHGSQVDLLLTDMIMPEGMTGRELAKELLERKPDLKVIYASGYTSGSMSSEKTSFMVKEGATFLQKPFQSQKLAETVRTVLDAGARSG